MVVKLTVLVLVGLVLAGGLCLFDDDEGAGDLCATSLAIMSALPVGHFLTAIGRPGLRGLLAYVPVPVDLPSPPPKV
jgi:hypothetical protein